MKLLIENFNNYLKEAGHEGIQKEVNADLLLPVGKEVILQADTEKHQRGLVVEWLEDGGYDVYYWYGDPKKVVPAELKADGVKIGDAIKRVYLGYHPELDDTKDKDKEEDLKESQDRIKKLEKAVIDAGGRNPGAIQALTKMSKMGKYNMDTLRSKLKDAKKSQTNEDLEATIDEKKKKRKKKKSKKKKDDRCTRIAKRKYDVWPSAYASGAVVKCRQGKIWKGLKESGAITEETEESLIKKITKVLRDEGGAAGMDALVKGTESSKKDIEAAIEDEETFVIHTDGDIILKDKSIIEIIKKIDGKYVVYPKSGGDRLGTHDTEGKAKKQLAAIEISKQKNEEIDLEEDNLDEKKKKKSKKKKAGTESSKESSLRDWFGRKGAKGKKGGWVDCNTCRKDKKTGRKTCKSCGRQKGEKRAKYPSCRPTPGACGEKGRGKSWGKKSAKGKK